MKKFLFAITTVYLLSSPMLLAQDPTPSWGLSGNSNATTSSKLGTTNDINLRFYTKNVLRMIINSVAGNVGIGMSNPTSRLQINSPAGTDPFRVQLNSSTKLMVHSTGGVTIGAISTPPPNNSLYVSGNVGIGTPLPSAKLHVVAESGTGVYGIGGTVGLEGYCDNFGGIGVYGSSGKQYIKADGLFGYGVYGISDVGYGVYGISNDGTGLFGSGTTYGVYATGANGTGIFASGYNYGVDASGVTAINATGESFGVSASGRSVGMQGLGYFGVSGVNSNNGFAVEGDCYGSGFGGFFTSKTGTALFARTETGAYAGEFHGDIYTTGSYLPSDKNLKENIQDFSSAMNILNQLQPKYYKYKNDLKYASLHLPKGIHYGLLAQDLELVLPNLIKESTLTIGDRNTNAIKASANGNPLSAAALSELEAAIAAPKENINIKAVNYLELIPIMIKAMQEQQSTIQEQNAKIETLTQLVNKLSLNPSVKVTGAYLGQSIPNPNSTSTRITYNIPDGFSKAELVINNEAGQKVKQMQLTKSGLIDIDTSGLSAGIYFYTLFVNGTSADTKKMVVTR